MAEEDKSGKDLRSLRIITAISLGKNRNKELAKVLDTDKSFTSKKVKELEDEGLIRREGEGRGTRYSLNTSRVLRFLKSRVVITAVKKKEDGLEKEKPQVREVDEIISNIDTMNNTEEDKTNQIEEEKDIVVEEEIKNLKEDEDGESEGKI